MAELYLDPSGFQSQIDSFKNGAECIKQIKYSLDKQGLRLQCIDKYIECLEEYNKAIELLGKLLDQDTKSMQLIKAEWMNADNILATKTLGEILSGK